MKVNVRLEVSDAARNALAVELSGHVVKRLATRDEVREFVCGVLAVLEAEGVEPRARVQGAPGEDALVRKLAAEGKPPGYIRGYINAGRAIAKRRAGAAATGRTTPA